MAVNDVIEEIQICEERASEIIAKANESATQILAVAEKNAEAIISKAVNDSVLDRKDSIAMARTSADKTFSDKINSKKSELNAKREALSAETDRLAGDVVGRIL